MFTRGNKVKNFISALLFVIASCPIGFSQAKPIDELRRMFDYQQKAPFDVKENGLEDKNGVRIHDISYASPKGGRVTAYLVVPSRKGKFAGVIFMHQRPGSRTVFLNEALQFAEAGAVSLLIDAPFSRTGKSKRDFDPTVTKPEYCALRPTQNQTPNLFMNAGAICPETTPLQFCIQRAKFASAMS
jgi:hypothetical protein